MMQILTSSIIDATVKTSVADSENIVSRMCSLDIRAEKRGTVSTKLPQPMLLLFLTSPQSAVLTPFAKTVQNVPLAKQFETSRCGLTPYISSSMTEPLDVLCTVTRSTPWSTKVYQRRSLRCQS